MLEEERFDSLVAHAVMNDRAINVPTLSLVAGPSRVDANATFTHPVNDMSRGALRAHVASNQVQIAQFQSLVKDRPGLRGLLTLNGDATATMQPISTGTDIQLNSLNANVSARNLEMEGKGLLVSEAGDVVLALPGRFHRAGWAPGQMDTRLAFNRSPTMQHNFAEDANGRQ